MKTNTTSNLLAWAEATRLDELTDAFEQTEPEPTLSLTDEDCLRLHGMSIACDDDNRTV